MHNEFKHMLLKIAALPLSDQRWMIKKLTAQQKRTFTQHKGTTLLWEARRFANLPVPNNQPVLPKLPDLCTELKNLPPLLVAIILEQGQFSWAQAFIAEYPYSLPNEEVTRLKAATKLALFNQWQKKLSFADQLEVADGSGI